MILYDIPDIRVYWSVDSEFLTQFKYEDPDYTKVVKFKVNVFFPKINFLILKLILRKPNNFLSVSNCPQCINDLSFWLPDDQTKFNANYFFDIVREIGGDLVEQVELVDQFEDKKTKRKSHCYRITYRSIDRTLSQLEVGVLHKKIEKKAVETFGVTIR